jgi:murein DD-endopeptidase MepM/ murein hydrolase activator NlpD
MQFIIVSGKTRSARTTTLSHRQLAVMAVAGLMVLPAVLGWVVWDFYARVGASMSADATVFAAQRAELGADRAALAATRRQAETDLNALAQRLGQLQAQLWRLNALGAHLVQMAGLDKAEFDFSAEPAMGGPEASVMGVAPALFPALDTLDERLRTQSERLTALETLLMNRQLEAAVTPGGWPVTGGWVSSGFGWRADPFTGRRAFHEGVDIASRLGSPIHAMGEGVVRYAGPRPGYGLLVEIIHGDIVTRYAHCKTIAVKVGDRVARGTPIATVGSSGRSTGPHLHFEVLRRDEPVNPRPYLQASAKG